MKKIYKTMVLLLAIVLILSGVLNIKHVEAKEPIMEYKYTVEESKIKRAQFIWTASLYEMKKDKILNDNDINRINSYQKQLKKHKKSESRLDTYSREKRALSISVVDRMVNEKIINIYQGKILKQKLNNYDISDLEE